MTGITTATIMNMLHPGLIMIAMGLVVLCVPKSVSRVLYVAAPVMSLGALMKISEETVMMYSITSGLVLNFNHYDRLSYIFLLVFCVIAIIATLYSVNAKNKAEMAAGLIYAGCNMGVVLAGDCLSLLVFWEMAALSSTYLVYCKHARTSTRAAFRYLLVHAFGGSMLLVGFLMYISKFGFSLNNISGLVGTPTFWIIFIGVAVNAAIPPINSWLPDAYPESTLGGTVFMGSFTTKTAIYLLIRLFAGSEWLVWVGAIMAVYGVLMAILENDVRRLLSYHIVSQLGMMIAALGVDSFIGTDAAVAHAITNIMFKGVLLMGAGAVIYATGKRKITELGGLGKKMPVTSVCFLIASLAIAGLPGLSGFASKALIMDAINEAGLTIPSLLVTMAGVGTLLSITLKINYYVFWGPCDEAAKNLEVKKVPWHMNLAMIAGTVITVLIGIFPTKFYAMMPNASIINPFHLDHVMEYIFIFIGGSIPFFIFLKRMRPHDEITLDFDWFYRRPLYMFSNWLSGSLNRLIDWCDDKALKGAGSLGDHMADPYMWTKKSSNAVIKNWSFENEDHRIGDVLNVIIFAAVIMVVIGAVIH